MSIVKYSTELCSILACVPYGKIMTSLVALCMHSIYLCLNNAAQAA